MEMEDGWIGLVSWLVGCEIICLVVCMDVGVRDSATLESFPETLVMET